MRKKALRAVLCLLGFALWTPVASRGLPLSLSVLGLTPTNTVQLSLNGSDGTNYDVEVSTDLISWAPFLSVTPSNGVAVFTGEAGGQRTLFFRALEQLAISEPVLGIQSSSEITTESLITPEDGGVADILLSDLRHLKLTVPPGCVIEPTPFTMTLVTNITGLPFSQGSFGAVMIGPETFILLGAGALEIDLPGVDTRQVASFEMNNDGSGFHLVVDRLFTDRVLIPVTVAGTYGSGLASSNEISSLVRPTKRKRGTGPFSDCSAIIPHVADLDQNQFPSSCKECFPDLVAEALAVDTRLRQLEICSIETPNAEKILAVRQIQGAPDATPPVPDLLSNVCPFYETEVQPLWPKAYQNCALGKVLLTFMLGLQRQYDYLDTATNATCKFTLDANLDAVCKSTRECLRETAVCCGVSGHKGSAKLGEAIKMAQSLATLNSSCFPSDLPGLLDDPDFKQIISDCITNAWFGTMTFTQKGDENSTTIGTDSTTVVQKNVDIYFQGAAVDSVEFQAPGQDGYLGVTATGTGLIRSHRVSTETVPSKCPFTLTPYTHYNLIQYDAIVVTNLAGGVNDNAFGAYDFSFTIHTNQTYEMILSSSTPSISAQSHSTYRGWNVGSCPGFALGETDSTLDEGVVFSLPMLDTLAANPVFPMSDSNVVTGQLTWRDQVSAYGLSLQSTLSWTFKKNPTNLVLMGGP